MFRWIWVPLYFFPKLVFDSKKRSICYQDVYCKSVKLSEGAYTLRAQFSSYNVDALTSLKTTALVLDRSLDKSIVPPLFKSLSDIFAGGTGTISNFKLGKGDRSTFWVGDLASGAAPSDAKTGDFLVGTLAVTSEFMKLQGDLYTVAYPFLAHAEDTPIVTDRLPPKSKDEELKEAIRDLEIKMLKKMEPAERLVLFSKLRKQYPEEITLFVEYLEATFDAYRKSDARISQQIEELLDASKNVLGLIDEADVSKYLGLNRPTDETSEIKSKLRKLMDTKKSALYLAYLCQSAALKDKALLDGTLNPVCFTEFQDSFEKCSTWSSKSMADEKYVAIWAWQKSQAGYNGSALKALSKWLSDAKNASKDHQEIQGLKLDILAKLGWALWIDYEKKWNLTRFPKSFSQF